MLSCNIYDQYSRLPKLRITVQTMYNYRIRLPIWEKGGLGCSEFSFTQRCSTKSIQILFTYLESNRPKNKSRVFVPVYVVAVAATKAVRIQTQSSNPLLRSVTSINFWDKSTQVNSLFLLFWFSKNPSYSFSTVPFHWLISFLTAVVHHYHFLLIYRSWLTDSQLIWLV